MTKTTARSIWFVAMVSLGLLLALIDGATVEGALKAALLMSGLFVVYMLGEAVYSRYAKKR